MTDALESPDGELVVLGLMWDPRASSKLIGLVDAEFFADDRNRILWEALSALAARGDSVEFSLIMEELQRIGHTADEVGGMDFIASLMDASPVVADPRPYATVLRDRWSARTLHRFCESTAAYLAEGKARDGGKKMADYLASKALSLFSDRAGGVPSTRGELLAELLADATLGGGVAQGIDLKYRALNDEIGPLAAGEVLGISAYSGGGKTNLAANLANGFLKDGVPTLIFGAEMGKRWVARMGAIESMTSQWCAEKRSWVYKDSRGDWHPWEQGLDRYKRALERMKGWPMEPILVPNISPADIITRTRVLRRKYPGQHVVAIVDHLHRLDYRGLDPNKAVGQATRDFKNAAAEDPDGLTFILLYQPRKPEDVDQVDRPVSYHQIRGDGLVGNELDTHISPFRFWVKTDDTVKTPWGTPQAIINAAGLPNLADPPGPKEGLITKGVKLSDEHVFIANDKRRIDGRGPNHIFGFHKPSGRIVEGDPMAEHGRQLLLDTGT